MGVGGVGDARSPIARGLRLGYGEELMRPTISGLVGRDYGDALGSFPTTATRFGLGCRVYSWSNVAQWMPAGDASIVVADRVLTHAKAASEL
jgi:hypothetical protein